MKDNVLQKFADLVERDLQVVKAEIEGISTELGCNEDQAFAVWKTRNSILLRSNKPQDILIRVLSRETPKIRTISTGESKVAAIDIIYVDSDGQVGWGTTSLWGDRADTADKVVVNKTYKANARFAYQPTKVKMSAFQLVEEISDDGRIPTIKNVVESWDIGKLENIENFVDNTELFKGMISKMIVSKDGSGRNIGFEFSTEDSLPITCWVGQGPSVPAVPEIQETLDNLHIGDWVLAYGYVNQRPDTSITLNARSIFAV